jgi:hypothetical protein
MDRIDVYAAIDSERGYQDFMTSRDDRPDMVDISVAGILLAMEECLKRARDQWYRGHGTHYQTMEQVRKIAGLAVKAGEQLGMSYRRFDADVVLPDGTQQTIIVTRVIPHGGHTDDAYQLVAEDGRIFGESKVVWTR